MELDRRRAGGVPPRGRCAALEPYAAIFLTLLALGAMLFATWEADALPPGQARPTSGQAPRRPDAHALGARGVSSPPGAAW